MTWAAGRRALAGVNRLLPLNHRLWPLVRAALPPGEHVAFPFHERQRLLIPRAWLNPYSVALLLHGSRRSNPEFALMDQFLVPRLASRGGGTLIDIGAGIGAITAWMRSRVPNPIRAYEPSPDAAAALRLTVAANRWSGVAVVPKALGAAPGTALLDQSPNSALLPAGAGETPARPPVEVPMTTLDADVPETVRVGLIKIDVEGYESEVLRGAERLIRRDRPLLWVEAHPRMLPRHGSSIETLIEFLGRLGYALQLVFAPPRVPDSALARLAAHYVARPMAVASGLRAIAQPWPEQVFVAGVPEP